VSESSHLATFGQIDTHGGNAPRTAPDNSASQGLGSTVSATANAPMMGAGIPEKKRR